MGLGKRGFHRKLRQLTEFVWTDGVARFYMVFTTIVGLSANRLLATDAAKKLVSTSLHLWLTGTVNQFIVTDDGDGTATGSLPQDIHTGATPEFVSETLSGLTAVRLVATDSNKLLESAEVSDFLDGSDLIDVVPGTSDGYNSAFYASQTYNSEIYNSFGGVFDGTTTLDDSGMRFYTQAVNRLHGH